MFSKQFWKDLLERATKSFGQGALNAMGNAALFSALEADYRIILSFAVGGFLLSAVTSIASAPISERGTASVVKGVENVVEEIKDEPITINDIQG